MMHERGTVTDVADEPASASVTDSAAAHPVLRGARFTAALPARFLIGCARLYQMTLSPLLGANCRFVPSCSEYYIEAVKKYGAISGSIRGALRICRCHPFHPGGFDPP